MRTSILVFIGKEVLHQRSCFPVLRIRPLQTLREGNSEAPDEEGILSIRFFRPSPARIAAQISIRSAHYNSASIKNGILIVVPRFVSFLRSDLLQQFRIPGRPKALFLRKGGRRDGLSAPSAPSSRSAECQSMEP